MVTYLKSVKLLVDLCLATKVVISPCSPEINYCIAGNFGEVINLAIWRFSAKSLN